MPNDDDGHTLSGDAAEGTGTQADPSPGGGLDRRSALRRLGLTAGGAVAATWVIDSFNPAAAQTGTDFNCGTGSVRIPKNRIVHFDISGGGGGGGGCGVHTGNTGVIQVVRRRRPT